ncbi:GerAB/ArcD/ProY family transporter [Cohnella sp. GCM10020058]|uniref:GerAB/ArcD/ProY family transporter n=1 Tax=Cohnella sp. GCM10020058 TaxID=3317330 RepID=UPI00362D8A4B
MDKSRQVVVIYLVTHFGLIFFLYPADIIASVSVGHWSAVLFGFAIHFTLIGIYLKGLSYFASQNVIDIFTGVSKVFAYIMLLPLALYFLSIMIIAIRAYAEIVSVIFLSETPIWTIMLLFLIVSTLVSLSGIEPLMRTGVLVALLFSPFLILVLILSFQNVDWRYALPVIDREVASFSYLLKRPFLQSLFAFVGGFLFLGFIPAQIPFKGRKIVWFSLVLLPFFLLSVYVPILTFGENTASKFPFPFIMAVDTVDVSWLMFDRVTIFFMISLLCFVILFLALVMWTTLSLLKRGLPFIKVSVASVLLPILVFIVCMLVPNWSAIEQLLWWNTYLRLYAAIVIPLTTLTLGIVRHRRGAVGQ